MAQDAPRCAAGGRAQGQGFFCGTRFFKTQRHQRQAGGTVRPAPAGAMPKMGGQQPAQGASGRQSRPGRSSPATSPWLPARAWPEEVGYDGPRTLRTRHGRTQGAPQQQGLDMGGQRTSSPRPPVGRHTYQQHRAASEAVRRVAPRAAKLQTPAAGRSASLCLRHAQRPTPGSRPGRRAGFTDQW